jgi:ribonucleoside-diphosphate reductase alpha chain
VRRTLAGEFAIINKYLIRDLVERGLWTDSLRDEVFRQRGSIQNIEEIPESIRDIYKTAWEIRQREILDQAIGRGPFVCQSQSLNIFVKNPTFNLLYSIHMYGWNRGLKTGSYYIRTAPAADMQQFTIDPSAAGKKKGKLLDKVGPETSDDHRSRSPDEQTQKVWVCKMEDGCEMCGS